MYLVLNKANYSHLH